MRQLAAFEEKKVELEKLGATIVAASVDTLDQATEVKDRGFSFQIAYDATKADGDLLGAWWESQRGYIQPTDFIIGRGGSVLGSMYGSGQGWPHEPGRSPALHYGEGATTPGRGTEERLAPRWSSQPSLERTLRHRGLLVA